MKIESILSICENPECHLGAFVPNRADQRYCCVSCKNKFNYLKKQDLIRNRYADVAEMIRVDKLLESLYSADGRNAVYSDRFLEALKVPINAAVNISKNTTSGMTVHFFSNFGITSSDGIKYSIIKRADYGK